jgi:DNA-binding winged helix-turn-helix (wHTH) protein
LWRSGDHGADEQVTLTPKAFDILRYLVENAGRLVTHNELLEALWPDVHVQPEVLKGQILSIRSALGDKVQKPQFIETLRGRDYRFIAPVRDHHGATPAKRRPEYDHQVLVGRTQSLAELNAFLSEALAGQPRLAFVVGEAGIGKTTLVDEFVARAAADHDLLASRGQCVEGYGGI